MGQDKGVMQDSHSPETLNPVDFRLLFLGIMSGVLVLVGLYFASLYNYLLFHILAEGFSIAVAFSLFMLAWNARRLMNNDFLLFVGISYFFVALLELVHTLGYKGMSIFEGYDTNFATQLWIAARYLQSFSLLLAPVFLRRSLNTRWVISGYAAITSLLLALVFLEWFPICFVEGQGLTPFKIISEYVICLILIIAGVNLYRRRDEFDKLIFGLMITSIALTVVSELAFTFYVSAYGLSNLFGHFLKLASFYLIYRAIVVTGLVSPCALMFRELKNSEEALRKSQEALERRIRERVQELKCLSDISSRLMEREKSIPETLKIVAGMIPPGWQNPEMTCARIVFEGEEFATENFRDTAWKQSVDLYAQGQVAGKVEVCYLEERPVLDEGPFLKEERQLIVDIARQIGIMIEHRRDEEEKLILQTRLQQAQKMESVGRLAGGVAHDFNNMLGVILGHTDMALEELDPAQPLYDNLTDIREAAVRSADLTRQLLAFARKQTIAPKVLNLNDTVEGMLKMLQRLIGEDIKLSWMPADGLWLVNIDPSQVDQILANLCVNARDAISDVGRITLETANVTFDEEYCAVHPGFAPGDFVLIAVSDNGCGMDRQTQDRIFEPFFTTKESGKGTGLGLATVYGIVKQNNGFINVYSEPGSGTTFKVYFPRHTGKADDKKISEVSGEPEMRGKEVILMVEDEPKMRKIAELMLTSLGYSVLSASTPSEAFRIAVERKEEISLLISDVVMPEMNGQDLALNLLSLCPSIKLLFMSGYTKNVIDQHCVLNEGINFIQKPFSKKDLAKKVREVLDG